MMGRVIVFHRLTYQFVFEKCVILIPHSSFVFHLRYSGGPLLPLNPVGLRGDGNAGLSHTILPQVNATHDNLMMVMNPCVSDLPFTRIQRACHHKDAEVLRVYRLTNGGRVESLSGRLIRREKSMALGRLLKYRREYGRNNVMLKWMNYTEVLRFLPLCSAYTKMHRLYLHGHSLAKSVLRGNRLA